MKCMVKCMIGAYLYSHYFEYGLGTIYRGLMEWDKSAPSERVREIETGTSELRYSHASAREVVADYIEAKKEAESVIDKYLQKFGPESVIKVSSKQTFSNHLNIKRSRLQTTGAKIVSHLDRSIKITEQCMELLEKLDELLVSFLADETVPIDAPLHEIPFWSAYPLGVWALLQSTNARVHSELDVMMARQYSSWFNWSIKESSAYLERDWEDRKARIPGPEVRIPVPDEPVDLGYTFPMTIVEAGISPSGNCKLELTGFESIAENAVRITFTVNLTGSSATKVLDYVYVYCAMESNVDTVKATCTRITGVYATGITDVPKASKGCMYADPDADLLSTMQGFSLLPIVHAAASILKELVPLLTANNLAVEDAVHDLEKVMKCIANSVKAAYVYSHYFDYGLITLCRGLMEWDKLSPSKRVREIEAGTTELRYSHAGAREAMAEYTEAKKEIESVLRKYLEKFGPEFTIKVSSKQAFSNHLNFKKSRLQTTGAKIVSHLDCSIKITEKCMELLERLDELLVSFLADERALIDEPLHEIPFWSAYPLGVWALLQSTNARVHSELDAMMIRSQSWFNWNVKENFDYMDKDWEDRKARIPGPEVRIPVPDEPINKGYIFPFTIIETRISPSGNCKFELTSFENIAVNAVRISFAVNLTGSSATKVLDYVDIHCDMESSADTVKATQTRITAINATGITDVPKASKGWFGLAKPSIKMTHHVSNAHWKVSRSRWGDVPTHFTLSFDASYKRLDRFFVNLTLGYKDLPKIQQRTHHSDFISLDTSAATKKT
ncbi:hypothetical protein CVT24_003037 [Panaeolus cyanescens]|uniref:Uncharacterized protein n=1 Tax=Panaeolus cyanescens TaxID=181874 RepID=A0A409VFQ0_9AGAR|nr:hypothetical protein CVT24_003037 [Panaeolus cyanescens]